VGLLDSSAEEPESKLLRYILTCAIFVGLLSWGTWWIFRFHKEKKTVEQFLNAVVANDLPQAYKIWKPASGYSYQDFAEDWGPSGYYGPIKSFHIETAQKKSGATGIIVVVELSPYQPFPDTNDKVKHYRTKEVYLWVESRDLSISFAP